MATKETYVESVTGPATYETVWTMTASDVVSVSAAKQWTTFAIEVKGSNNAVSWICQDPQENVFIALFEKYGVYISSEKVLPDGIVLKTFTRFPIELGNAYDWTGSDLVSDKQSTCQPGSVKLSNKSEEAWTLGMTMPELNTNVQQPICADVFLPNQSAEYTPQLTISAKVGWVDKVGSVINDIGSDAWARFDLTSVLSTFKFDALTSKWTV